MQSETLKAPKDKKQTQYNLTLYLIETPFNAFANRADPDQAALVRAAWSVSILFAYGNMIRYAPILADLTSSFFVLCTNMKVYRGQKYLNIALVLQEE